MIWIWRTVSLWSCPWSYIYSGGEEESVRFRNISNTQWGLFSMKYLRSRQLAEKPCTMLLERDANYPMYTIGLIIIGAMYEEVARYLTFKDNTLYDWFRIAMPDRFALAVVIKEFAGFCSQLAVITWDQQWSWLQYGRCSPSQKLLLIIPNHARGLIMVNHLKGSTMLIQPSGLISV